MKFELKTDLHDLAACLRGFLALARDDRWKKRVVQLVLCITIICN